MAGMIVTGCNTPYDQYRETCKSEDGSVTVYLTITELAKLKRGVSVNEESAKEKENCR